VVALEHGVQLLYLLVALVVALEQIILYLAHKVLLGKETLEVIIPELIRKLAAVAAQELRGWIQQARQVVMVVQA